MSGGNRGPWVVNIDLVGGWLLLVIAAVALVNAREATFNVWIFPRVTAMFLALVGTGLVIKGWRSPERRAVLEGGGAGTVLGFAFGLIVYGMLFSRAGFIPTTIVAYGIATWVLRRQFTARSALLSLAIGVAVTMTLHQIFTRVFYVPLPDGSWWQG